jgi:hypothetical protein
MHEEHLCHPHNLKTKALLFKILDIPQQNLRLILEEIINIESGVNAFI